MDIEKILNNYFDWLKNQTKTTKFSEYQEITLPFLDFYNDHIQIYAAHQNDIYILTDDSYVINNLEMSGIKITQSREKLLDMICKTYGVTRNEKELKVQTNEKDLMNKLHNFVQAILKIDDLHYTSQTRTINNFLDDVLNFFERNEIYYSENVHFIGKSGLTHSYDFLFQRTKSKKERLCKLMNNASKANMGNVLFSWTDTAEERKRVNHDSELIVLINDNNRVESEVIEGFISYNVVPIMWTKIINSIDSFR